MSELFKASVKGNIKVAENHFLLTLQPLQDIQPPIPGQFFMISVDNMLDPLLKRPFGNHRWSDGCLQILYKVVGKATGILKGKREGSVIEVIGPLGNGFPSDINENVRPLIIAGGIGIAPMLAFADDVSEQKPILFYGARNKDELVRIDEFTVLGVEAIVSTDDGSAGSKGLITSLLAEFLTSHASRITDYSIYACGPKPMLASLASVSEQFKVKTYMLLEESMACGIGTCLGCIVKTTGGYKRVCKEGPVFSSDEIIF